MLLQCSWRFSSSRDPSSRLRQLVCGTLDHCMRLRLESGNFPSSEIDDPDEEYSDRLVQWCHGAPGLALACTYTFELWSESKYLQAALQSGEVMWARGLLKKGKTSQPSTRNHTTALVYL
jgi:hypothetical protein